MSILHCFKNYKLLDQQKRDTMTRHWNKQKRTFQCKTILFKLELKRNKQRQQTAAIFFTW